MKSAPLPKGQSQLEVKATLRHRGQVNDTVSVSFEPEPKEKAFERYTRWAAQILDHHSTQDREAHILASNAAGVWKTKYNAIKRVLEDLVVRCDGEDGVRADGSNIDTSAAHAILDRNENESSSATRADGERGRHD